MLILGIETSCDETSAAVVEETGDAAKPWSIRSNIVASQVAIHREWGGVVPELASRQHIRDICGVVDRALAEAETTWRDLGAIAVTQGPGLVGSLLVGVSYAKAAAAATGVPLVAVHHLAGHIAKLRREQREFLCQTGMALLESLKLSALRFVHNVSVTIELRPLQRELYFCLGEFGSACPLGNHSRAITTESCCHPIPGAG
jgi:tRNA A37 threonylcarbamoyltransferase TsaD